jgi:lauroyl/myristoyl acyltransferase
MTHWYKHSYHTPFSQRVMFAIVPRMPKFMQPPIAVITAFIFFSLLGDERRAIVSNLRRIRRGCGPALLWKAYWVFYSFCDLMVSYCYVPSASHDGLLAMLASPHKGREIIDDCLREGNGLIVWTAHLGNWEFASRLLELHGRPVHVARVVEGNPAEKTLRDLMTNDLLRVVRLNDDVMAPLKLLHALRANEIVAIQGDRIYEPYGADMQFFGSQARFPLGPFLLAYVSGAPILPGFVVRHGWLRYRVIMGKPIRLVHTSSREKDLRIGLAQAARFLEDNVKVYPDQWLNFFEIWNGGVIQAAPPCSDIVSRG